MSSVHETVFELAFALKSQSGNQQKLRDMGLTPMHIRALRVVWRQENTTAQMIARVLKRDKAQITRVINKLIEVELVEKRANPSDKRSQLLFTTAPGEAFFKHIEAKEAAMRTLLTQGISDAEMETFLDVASRLTRNLEQM